MDKVVSSCEKNWDANKSDCSGFVKAVASDLGIILHGQANQIIDSIAGKWQQANDGPDAAAKASAGNFVIGGLKDRPNGHVVVIVNGPLNRSKYPTAYWGTLGGVGKKNTTINWSWNETERDLVKYWYCKIGQ